jgi:hypothetical protein
VNRRHVFYLKSVKNFSETVPAEGKRGRESFFRIIHEISSYTLFCRQKKDSRPLFLCGTLTAQQ